MTKRKPANLSHEDWIALQIREARERGLLENLPGEGRPLDLRDADDPLWWAKKLVQREGLSIVPPSVEIKRTVELVLAGLPELSREQEARDALLAVNEEIRRTNSLAHAGPPTVQAPLDVEERLAEWRRIRAELEGRDGDPDV
jgi:hypothetical protein